MDEVSFVSIVVPTRNRAHLLGDCLLSLSNQSYPKSQYEIIVVDDGSKDSTGATVQKLVERLDSDVHLALVEQQPLGISAARNVGIERARGDPIIFVDDDVEAPPGWLAAFVEGTVRHCDAGCVGGAIRIRFEGKLPRMCGAEGLRDTELDLGEHEAQARVVWGANMGVRRWALGRVGGFNESLTDSGDDEEWIMRLRNSGGLVWYLPQAWVWHRRTQTDLALGTLIRRKFQRGRTYVRFARATGAETPRLVEQLSGIPRLIGHSLRRRCAWGLLASAARLGVVWGLLTDTHDTSPLRH